METNPFNELMDPEILELYTLFLDMFLNGYSPKKHIVF